MDAPRLDNKSYYDEFSGWYDRGRDQGYHALLDVLELGIAGPYVAGKRVLEAGCGTGLILQELARHASQAIGADLSAGMVAKARERDLTVVQASVTDLPFPDNSFDVVCSFKVLAHVEAIREALTELARVTRPGGAMVLEFYNPRSLRYLVKRLRPGNISAETTEDAVFTRWDTPTTLRGHLPEGVTLEGLRGVRVFTPFAAAHKVPVLRSVLGAMERWAVDSPLRGFGGFMVAILRVS
jgi:ubiquinone/menaquinone biosynthesis C-methylase UbiE